MIRREQLSPTWQRVLLRDVVEFLDYLRKPVTKIDRTDGQYPYYGANGQQGTIDNFIFDEPLVLLAEDGGNFGQEGRTVAYKVEGKCWVNNHAHVLRPKPNIDINFLLRHLEYYDVTPYITGTTRGKLTKDAASRIELVLPPLPEQKRIAAILDKADAIRRKRQQAVKLTEELLRSVFLDMFGDPVTNPKGWETCCLGDVIQKIESGWSPVCEEGQAEENEWGVLKLGAVTTCKYLDTESKALPAGTSPRPELEVKTGDLLFTRKNTYDLVAASVLVYATRPKLMLSDLIFRLKLKDDSAVISEYLWALLSSNGKRKQIQSLAGGSSGSMPNISKSKLMEQMIEVPPMAIQKKYANILHGNYSIRNKLEATAQSSNTLFNSLLQRAFTGNV